VLSTIDGNPEIIAQIIPALGAAASELGRTAGRSVDKVVGAVGSAVPDLNRSVDEVVGAVESAAPDLDRSVAEMIGEPDEGVDRTRRPGKPGRPKTQP
jgi:hypothetical protein